METNNRNLTIELDDSFIELQAINSPVRTIEDITRDTQQLKEIFADMHELLRSQEEDINKIEVKTQDSLASVSKAETELKDADTYQNSYLKKVGYATVSIAVAIIAIFEIIKKKH